MVKVSAVSTSGVIGLVPGVTVVAALQRQVIGLAMPVRCEDLVSYWSRSRVVLKRMEN